jgi:cytoskeletal protein CcmA (bactofilin family)
MAIVGPSIVIVGEVRASGDVTIDGRLSGPLMCEGGTVSIGATAVLEGDVVARDITVFGRATGRLIATEVVDVRRGAVVAGQAIAPSFILHDGAQFQGHVEPQRLAAALSVARFQQKQRDRPAG